MDSKIGNTSIVLVSPANRQTKARGELLEDGFGVFTSNTRTGVDLRSSVSLVYTALNIGGELTGWS